MTTLQFENLTVQNFQTFIGKHKFALADSGAGLVFMRGRNRLEPSLQANDAGKTTLWNALCWCLYGSTIDGLRSPDVRPWDAWNVGEDASTAVRVGFLMDGKERDVERCTVPNALKLDGKTCGQGDIDRLLQMSKFVFCHTILMGQGQPLFFDLEPREAMALFGEGLNLARWDTRSQFAKEECDRLEKKLAKYDGELIATKASLEDARHNMTRVKKQSDEWEAGNKATIRALTAKLTEAQKELKEQGKFKDDATLAYDGAGTELKALQQEISQLRASYDAAHEKKLRHEGLISSLKRDKERREKELKSLGEADECPTCGQEITGTSLDKHKKELKREIANLNAQIEKGVPKAITKEIETFIRSIGQSRGSEAKFKEKADDAFSGLQRLSGLVATLDANVKNMRERIEEAERATNTYHAQYVSFKADVKELKGVVEDIEADIARAQRTLDRTRPWIKGFKDIRLLVVDQVLKELEFVTNSILVDLGLDGWTVKYDIERETKSGGMQRGLHVSVLSPRNKAAVKWKCWGGGVGQRLRIAGALSLSEILLNHAGVVCNLEVLDEPSRHMSKSGVRDLCDYLADRAIKTNKTIFYVDHMSVESDKFTDVVTIVKDESGSRITWT
jgi:DNA repair exonuclease SbcCD ATPase subunit